LDGIINLHKPPGLTSHAAVLKVRRLSKTKVGHSGTLDPAASGVLILCLGKATRLSRFFTDYPKEYIANLQLGVDTTTDDAEGDVLAVSDTSALTAAAVEAVLSRFTGPIRQVPPRYSAIHHQGKRLYELARQGIEVDSPARDVVVERIKVLGWALPFVTLSIRCSKGTYIRSLCRDIGAALEVGGHLSSLIRTRVGSYSLNTATSLSALSSKEAVQGALLPLKQTLVEIPALRVDKDAIIPLLCGQTLTPAELVGEHTPLKADQHYRLLDAQGELLALGKAQTSDDKVVLKPERVFKKAETISL